VAMPKKPNFYWLWDRISGIPVPCFVIDTVDDRIGARCGMSAVRDRYATEKIFSHVFPFHNTEI
jgi:hypothetical protein